MENTIISRPNKGDDVVTLISPKLNFKGNETMAISSEEFGVLKEKVDNIDKVITRIDDKLFGNGQLGIVVNLSTLTNTVDALAEKVKGINIKVDKIDIAPVRTWLDKNWRTLIFLLTAFFLLIHSIVPVDASIWTVIQKIF